MITGKIDGKDIQIPTSWDDVPFKKYIEYLDCDNVISQAEVLLGVGGLGKLNSEGLGAILMAMSFMQEVPNAFLPELEKIDIGRESYGRLEMAKSALMAADKPYKALTQILKIYTGNDYSDKPTSIAYPLAAFFLTNCNDFLSVTKD